MHVGASAFEGCSSARAINIDRSLQNIGARAFSGCSAVAAIACDRSDGKCGRLSKCDKVLLQVNRRRHPRHLLEKAAEMVGILKAKEVCHFTYAESFHQQGFCLIYNEVVDIAYSSPAGCLMNHVAEVTGRIGKF